MELYKDCQADYEKNLNIFLSTENSELKKQAYDNIFIDFKTYCFNKIRQMRPFLSVETIDDWSIQVTCNALSYILKKDYHNRDNWPKSMGAYLGLCCLDINNVKKYNREKLEIPVEEVFSDGVNEEGENLLMIDEKLLDEETGTWLIKEAVKMTVINDGYSMIDVDRTVTLINKYGNKLGRFSKKYTDIKNALEKNILFILNIKKEENEQ